MLIICHFQEKVLARQAGQKSVDTVSDGQRQVIVEPEILYPTKEVIIITYLIHKIVVIIPILLLFFYYCGL